VRTVYAWHGEDAHIDKLTRNRIERVWFAANDASPAQIKHARDNGFQTGIYVNPQWYDYPDAKVFRNKISEAIKRLVGGFADPLPVQINNERHDPVYMLAIMFWYRRSMQLRETAWNFEGYQGGWIGPIWRTSYSYTHADLVEPVTLTAALLANVELIPQCYDSVMNPYDPHDVVSDLVDWGVPHRAINPMKHGSYAVEWSRRKNQHFYRQSELP
jgi:hypothetical protein